MGGLAKFVEGLFAEGRVLFDGPPDPAPPDREEAAAVLRGAFVEEALDLAGPVLSFDAKAALIAAEWSRRACWYLISRSEAGEVVERALTPPPDPTRPSQHLAADLTFRYLPLVHRRARATAPDDLLTARLALILRRWPLSGVLSDLHDEPLGPLDFGGHAGLLMRYAERLSSNEKAAWVPAAGSLAREYYELVGGRSGPSHREVPVDV